MNLRIPDVAANAVAACGAGEWLRDLPGLIAEFEAEWSVSVGRPFPHATEAFVAEASLADGTPAVLKLLIPQVGAAGRHEITMLRLTGGRGCVGLLRGDAARGALLLERLGPSLYELGHPLAERLEILVMAAATVWRPAPGSGLLDGDPWARAHWLAERCGLDATAIWEWGVVERVTSGLRCTRINLQPLGRHMLEVADRLATL